MQCAVQILLVMSGVAASGEPPLTVIPLPRQVTPRDGYFTLGPATRIVADSACEQVAAYLRGALAPATGLRLPVGVDDGLINLDAEPIGPRGGGSVIVLRLVDDAERFGSEGYSLTVTRERIEIVAAAPAGACYGVQTLRQMLPPAVFRRSKTPGVDWRLPCAVIEDAPRFSWRGAHMDVVRHFMPKEFILEFLDLMALHKLNRFHWHLTDDQGWRIAIRQYPELTEQGSHYDYSLLRPDRATRSMSVRPGGFYTQDDVREIVAYAAERFITVVPEIELPGHSWIVMQVYPHLGDPLPDPVGGDLSWNVQHRRNRVYNVEHSTLAFLKEVFTEVLELFPGPFIHVGGDEVKKTQWQNSPRTQARMRALGLKNEEELQSWFIRQFDAFLAKRGRRLIGWDEILQGGLAPGATVMSWRGVDGGIAAARLGHDVVMTPSSHTYFDRYQARPTCREPLAYAFLPLDVVYAFEPVPPVLTPAEAGHILGTQFQLWAEFMPDPRHMEYMAFPRGCALAEVAWSAPEARDYAGFLSRLEVHLRRLDVLDVNYRPLGTPEVSPAGRWQEGEIGEAYTTREWDVTSLVRMPGQYVIEFVPGDGRRNLDVAWVEIREEDAALARSEGVGRAVRHPRFIVDVLGVDTQASRVLRAEVRAAEGDDSSGAVYICRPGAEP